MSNKEIYVKTLGFSVRRMVWDILAIVFCLILMTVGFAIGDKVGEAGVVGLIIGLIVAIILIAIVMRFVAYTLQAGQIAMMTRGIVEGELPDNVIAEGKKVVKERFATVALYFAATKAIKGIFNQLGKVITNIGSSVGGDTGKSIGDAINSIIQVVISYLSDCCLGWVFYRKEVKAAKATCEGAVLFFKHGKTFAKNMGRVFGIGLVSLLIIGGAFTGIFYAILASQSQALEGLYTEVAASAADMEGAVGQLLQNTATLPIVFAAIGGIIVWSIIHSIFIRPFVLTGVPQNYLHSGMNDIPTEDNFTMLDSKSDKFRKLHNSI